MKKNVKIISITAGVLSLGVGGWWLTNETVEKPIAEHVLTKEALPADMKAIDESTKAEAIVSLYREMEMGMSVAEDGKVSYPTIDPSLIEETQIENYPFPMTENNKKDPEMTKLLSLLLSRTDKSTNEVENKSVRIVDKKTFSQWERLFPKWVNGELDEKETASKWMKVQKDVKDWTLAEPAFVKHEFPYDTSAVDMMNEVLTAVQEKGASTAPHIAFVEVLFDEEASMYTLYYAETHIE